MTSNINIKLISALVLSMNQEGVHVYSNFINFPFKVQIVQIADTAYFSQRRSYFTS